MGFVSQGGGGSDQCLDVPGSHVLKGVLGHMELLSVVLCRSVSHQPCTLLCMSSLEHSDKKFDILNNIMKISCKQFIPNSPTYFSSSPYNAAVVLPH